MTKQELAPVNDLAMSPELAALPTAKMRAFVDCLFEQDGGGKLLKPTAAARASGYAGDSHQLNSIAQRLVKDPRITAAIKAETQRRIRNLGPDALAALTHIMGDWTHKDRLKAVNVVLERVDPVAQKIDVQHTHVVDHTKTALEHLKRLKDLGVSREVLVREFGEIGLARWEGMLAQEQTAPQVIDAEFTEVSEVEDWEKQ
jgi:phage terminase small subunit